MAWVAVAIGGSALVGGAASMYGANKQAGAAGHAADLQAAQQQQTTQNLYPWLYQGGHALNELSQGTYNLGKSPLLKPFSMADFQQSPSYQWQLQQGQQAIDKGAAARGNYYAPQTLQDLSKFNQGLAGTDFNNAYNQYTQNQQQQFNMLQQLSGGGQNAAVQQGGFGQAATNNIGNYQTGGAAAQAEGYMGAANAFTGGGLGIAGYGAYLNQLQNGQYQVNTQPYNWSNNPYGSAAAYDN